MRHICLYISDPDFYSPRDGRDGQTDQPKVVQEVLADLKMWGGEGDIFKTQNFPVSNFLRAKTFQTLHEKMWGGEGDILTT